MENQTIDRTETYYDITAIDDQPDQRYVGVVTWREDQGYWASDIYEYTLTDAQLIEGLSEGWLVVAADLPASVDVINARRERAINAMYC